VSLVNSSGGRQTLASSLRDRIRADIIRGDFLPGQKLKIAEIAAFYKVGMIPVREALSRLASSGFVEGRDQRGFAVREVSATELLDLTKVRILIESQAFRESLAQGGAEWEARVKAAQRTLSGLSVFSDAARSKIHTNWERAHDALHAALLSGCGSSTLLKYAQELRDQTTRYRHISAASRRTAARDVAAEHARIVDAALARKIDLAVALLCDHINTSTQFALAKFQEAGLVPEDLLLEPGSAARRRRGAA